MGKITLAFVFLATCSVLYAQQPTPLPPPSATVPAPRSETEPKLQLSFCKFSLNGTDSTGHVWLDVAPGTGVLPSLANAGGVTARDRAVKYFEQVTPEVRRSYEKEIGQSGRYQMVSSNGLVDSDHSKHLSLAQVAQRNHLYACVSVSPTWAAKMGWDKKLAITTTWEVESADGCRVKFKTSLSSQQTYGKFPYGSDPRLQSAYLDLSAQDARQFSNELQKEMRNRGCEK